MATLGPTKAGKWLFASMLCLTSSISCSKIFADERFRGDKWLPERVAEGNFKAISDELEKYDRCSENLGAKECGRRLRIVASLGASYREPESMSIMLTMTKNEVTCEDIAFSLAYLFSIENKIGKGEMYRWGDRERRLKKSMTTCITRS